MRPSNLHADHHILLRKQTKFSRLTSLSTIQAAAHTHLDQPAIGGVQLDLQGLAQHRQAWLNRGCQDAALHQPHCRRLGDPRGRQQASCRDTVDPVNQWQADAATLRMLPAVIRTPETESAAAACISCCGCSSAVTVEVLLTMTGTGYRMPMGVVVGGSRAAAVVVLARDVVVVVLVATAVVVVAAASASKHHCVENGRVSTAARQEATRHTKKSNTETPGHRHQGLTLNSLLGFSWRLVLPASCGNTTQTTRHTDTCESYSQDPRSALAVDGSRRSRRKTKRCALFLAGKEKSLMIYSQTLCHSHALAGHIYISSRTLLRGR